MKGGIAEDGKQEWRGKGAIAKGKEDGKRGRRVNGGIAKGKEGGKQ